MNYFVMLMCFLSGVGITLAAYYIIVFFKSKSAESGTISARKTALDGVISDAENAVQELNDMSEVIFRQLDEKYKELLFVYDLIDNKKIELLDTHRNIRINNIKKGLGSASNAERAVYDRLITDGDVPAFKNTKYFEIRELKRKGHSVADIAKSLGIGKGEVQLILNLGKVR